MFDTSSVVIVVGTSSVVGLVASSVTIQAVGWDLPLVASFPSF